MLRKIKKTGVHMLLFTIFHLFYFFSNKAEAVQREPRIAGEESGRRLEIALEEKRLAIEERQITLSEDRFEFEKENIMCCRRLQQRRGDIVSNCRIITFRQ